MSIFVIAKRKSNVKFLLEISLSFEENFKNFNFNYVNSYINIKILNLFLIVQIAINI